MCRTHFVKPSLNQTSRPIKLACWQSALPIAKVRTAAFCTVYAWNNAVPELLRQSSPVIVIYTQSKMSHAASSVDVLGAYSDGCKHSPNGRT